MFTLGIFAVIVGFTFGFGQNKSAREALPELYEILSNNKTLSIFSSILSYIVASVCFVLKFGFGSGIIVWLISVMTFGSLLIILFPFKKLKYSIIGSLLLLMLFAEIIFS